MIQSLPLLSKPTFLRIGKRNMWSAYGAVEKERSDALKIMGVTCCTGLPIRRCRPLCALKDMDVVYGGCDALNRGMADFCADDPNLKAVGYLSLRDPEQAFS